MSDKNHKQAYTPSISDLISRMNPPKKAVITAGMPYANGPIHLGHLAGAHIPADVYSRFMKMLIGSENVLYVCGTDDHGSTSEIAASQKGQSIHEHIAAVHDTQRKTMERYNINLDTYTGTSTPETFAIHKEVCADILQKLKANGLLTIKTSKQWFDVELERFLPDRYVRGTCPKCGSTNAYSSECGSCEAQYEPEELTNTRSILSDKPPVLRDTDHLWLDMWSVSDSLREWVESKKKVWRKLLYNEVSNQIMAGALIAKEHEATFKELKPTLPTHKSSYAPGKKILIRFQSLNDLDQGIGLLEKSNIPAEVVDGWAHRSVTRDTKWGIPIPANVAEGFEEKSFYVWPDSLIAPISFTKLALKQKGQDPDDYKLFWKSPDAQVYQFLGQDNVFFYTVMQGALWFGSQEDYKRQPLEGELQLTDVFASYHLQVNGEKMSKSTGNFFTGDQMLDEMSYDSDQVRYHLSILSLAEKSSNFDIEHFNERNKFLAGPLNASFEKPISATHRKFGSVVPEGQMLEKADKETTKIIRKYLHSMQKAEYSTLLYAIENYARQINSLFAQHKPHDDRFPEQQRKDALFSSLSILKNLMIMLSPFAPATMDRLRESLNLPEESLRIQELGNPIPAGHRLGDMREFFPKVEE